MENMTEKIKQDNLAENAIDKMHTFDIFTEKEFKTGFLNIIIRGSKDNTYKFALARFLIDYSMEKTETHVEFSTIAKYFLRYYWPQICKLKMKHAPQTNKQPEIVRIIEKEFPKNCYPETFKKACRKYPENMERCIKQIVAKCFHNVIWRFQRMKMGRATQVRLFFDYEIKREIHSNKKLVDLDYGINLNPEAMKFFKRHDVFLLKAVILEWAKFLEKLNDKLPKIIVKTEGLNKKRGGLTKFRKALEPICNQCFYCKEDLPEGRQRQVEHVIPFDYIAEDDIWNLTLVCQKCNLQKLGSLPPWEYIEKLIERNRDFKTEIDGLEKSLNDLNQDFGEMIKQHYDNAKAHGYLAMKKFQCSQS